MSKQLQLRIPTPCHENWDVMTPADKGKFCSSCQKQVVDFSEMNDRQIAAFFKKTMTSRVEQSVCGRFMADQLDRNIAMPRKRIPWVKYFFQFVIPAFLVSIKASGQKISGKTSASCVKYITNTSNRWQAVTSEFAGVQIDSKLQTENTLNPFSLISPSIPPLENQVAGAVGNVAISTEATTEIKGIVISESHRIPMPGTAIHVNGTNRTAVTDVNGEFKISVDFKIEKIVLTIRAAGFNLTEKTIEKKRNSSNGLIDIGKIILKNQVLGGLSITVTKRNSQKPTTLVQPVTAISQRAASPAFRVFPNPALSGAAISVEWEKIEEGNYTIQLLNQWGQVVHRQELTIDSKSRLVNMILPPVVAGNYFIAVTGIVSGEKFAGKIIIQ